MSLNPQQWFPVRYHLDDGRWTRGVCIGVIPDLGAVLLIDLRRQDGRWHEEADKADWFDVVYADFWDGLVPECATEGSEPGQWQRAAHAMLDRGEVDGEGARAASGGGA